MNFIFGKTKCTAGPICFKGKYFTLHKNIILPFEAINLHTIEVEVFKTFTNNVLYSFHLGIDNEYSSDNLVRLGKVIKQKVFNLANLAPGSNEKTGSDMVWI